VNEFLAATDSDKSSWWVIGLVALFLSVGGLIFNAGRTRSKEIESVARSRGIPFRRSASRADETLPIGCSLEHKGTGHVISNILEAVRGEEMVLTMFDYEYTHAIESILETISDQDSTQSYNQTVVRMQSPLLRLPYFDLFPETIFATLGKMFGGSDINFDETEEFSRKYILRGGDERALRALFTPQLREFLERLGNLTIQGADDVLFLYRWTRLTKPKDLPAAIEENKQLFALFLEGQQSAD